MRQVLELRQPLFPACVDVYNTHAGSRLRHFQPAFAGQIPVRPRGASLPAPCPAACPPSGNRSQTRLESQPRGSTPRRRPHRRVPGPPEPAAGETGGAGAGRACARHAPGRAGVTDSSSPHRKWATARREEPAVAWRLRAFGRGFERLALPTPRHGTGRQRAAAAPGLHDAAALAAPPRDGLRVQGGDRSLGGEVARDPAAAGSQVGASGAPPSPAREDGRGRGRCHPAGPSEPPAPPAQVPGARPSEHRLLPPPCAQPSCGSFPRSSCFASPAVFKLRDFCSVRLEFVSIYEGKKSGRRWMMECGVYCKHLG